ncbi:unnamed protein product [Paramecium sonneborni]|uniref:Uncharacterized protein n=1 Tax=Paramecium sonneborni TaxID=65129 RepID=A0A8S1P8N4_9CILI|nr:unnamed protein product [Paramecium sonneborni]
MMLELENFYFRSKKLAIKDRIMIKKINLITIMICIFASFGFLGIQPQNQNKNQVLQYISISALWIAQLWCLLDFYLIHFRFNTIKGIINFRI